MAKLSAKTTILITNSGPFGAKGKSTITTTVYKVGNCKLFDSDLDTLIRLGQVSKEHPVTVDFRK